MLVVWSRKQIMPQKLVNLKKKLTDHNHGKYITSSEFNNLTTGTFNATLAQASLVTKTDFDAKLSTINRPFLVENELKTGGKHLI